MTNPNQPANAAVKAAIAAQTRRQEERVEAPRSRPANFGGPRMKLAVASQIEGYHLYWENDENGQIEQLLQEGFELVRKDEVGLARAAALQSPSHVVADEEVAGHVTRYVGSKDDGTPLRAYLLKLRNDLWEEREAYRYEEASMREETVRRGLTNPDPSQYTPRGVQRRVEQSNG